MSALDFFASEITESVRQIAVDRILNGGNLAVREDLPKATIKLALIIVQSVNPHEVLYQEEAAILYGLSPKTVANRQNTGELYLKVNAGK